MVDVRINRKSKQNAISKKMPTGETGIFQIAKAMGNQSALQLGVSGDSGVVQKCGDSEEVNGFDELFGQEAEGVEEVKESPSEQAEVQEEISETEREERKAEIADFISRLDGFLDSKVDQMVFSGNLYRGDSFIPTVGYIPKGKEYENKVIHFVEHSNSNRTAGFFISTSQNIDICKGFDGVRYISTMSNVNIVNTGVLKAKIDAFAQESKRILELCDSINDLHSKARINFNIVKMNVAKTYSQAQEEELAVGPIPQASISKVISRESGWGEVPFNS